MENKKLIGNLRESQVPSGVNVVVGFDGTPIEDVGPSDLDMRVSAWMGRVVAFVDDAAELVWMIDKKEEIGALMIFLSSFDPGDVFAVNLVGVAPMPDEETKTGYWVVGIRCRQNVKAVITETLHNCMGAEFGWGGPSVGDMWEWDPEENGLFVSVRLVGDAPRAYTEQQLRMVGQETEEAE